jgi:hypothetical protein
MVYAIAKVRILLVFGRRRQYNAPIMPGWRHFDFSWYSRRSLLYSVAQQHLQLSMLLLIVNLVLRAAGQFMNPLLRNYQLKN